MTLSKVRTQLSPAVKSRCLANTKVHTPPMKNNKFEYDLSWGHIHTHTHIYIYMHIYTYMYIYTYTQTYIHREKEREREKERQTDIQKERKKEMTRGVPSYLKASSKQLMPMSSFFSTRGAIHPSSTYRQQIDTPHDRYRLF
mgnify:CR=1 FL=1